MLIPYRINTLFQQYPIANWAIIAVTTVVSFAALLGNSFWPASLVLDGWHPLGMLGHQFLHADLMHLLGNMIFLWVFGNAISGNVNHAVYLGLYLAFGIIAAVTHNVFEGGTAVGASGAINGVVGMATAMYPRNRVSVFLLFIIRPIFFESKLWILSILWLLFDVAGIVFGSEGVAVWAHVGGFAAGIVTGTLFLRLGIVQLTKWDNESLSEILFGR